ncbi:MAG: putative actin family protein [Streblomastix strix]|uniref:Putative actin family protein n=1 Tax=Streblomastix strix TaxID=222440 RepID=A0A5J4X382_9EUKA|nr:MAG: putative actin family protein [Streblomastix strix]
MKNSRASVRITSMRIEHRYIRDQNGDIKSIVLDNGSGIMKVGMAGEDKPRSVFPQIIEQNEKDYKIGDDAFSLCDNMNLHYPIEHGNVNNWEEMEKIWNYTFSNILHVNSYEFPILISEPVLNPEINRQKMTEIMFEKYQIPALYYENSGVLSLYSTGRTFGVVLESGDCLISVVPIYNGLKQPNGIFRNEMAGRDVTVSILRELLEKGVQLNYEIAKDIKEKLCYIVMDYKSQKRKAQKLVDMTYTMPDGQEISIGSERFRCPEAIFKPSLIGFDMPGVHNLVFQSIQNCDSKVRNELFKSICISGGTSMLNGFAERLNRELQILAPKTADINIIAPPDRQFSVWVGGSILASMKVFGDWLITKQEYKERGYAVVKQNCV